MTEFTDALREEAIATARQPTSARAEGVIRARGLLA
jgi:hypothetical protein